MNQPDPIYLSQAMAPGLFQHLAAIFYDSLLLLGVLAVATALAMPPLGEGPDKQIGSGNLLFQAYLLLVGIGFLSGSGPTVARRSACEPGT
jgi:uncharacterized membrane protein